MASSSPAGLVLRSNHGTIGAESLDVLNLRQASLSPAGSCTARERPSVPGPQAETIVARLNRFLSSTVGRKVIMAITGLMMMGFLVGHLTGNLLLHKGSDGKAFNDYGHALTSTPLI